VSAGQLRPGEVSIDEALVRRLVAAQYPQWADLAEEARIAMNLQAPVSAGRLLAALRPGAYWRRMGRN